jgi:1,2-dihydroxy-3-keto-5-methylthiopentene dioxygenase
MATLTIPDKGITLDDAAEIRFFLAKRGILYEQWKAECAFSPEASQDEILTAYAATLQPYMAHHGYQTADVISVHAETPNIQELRAKFLREHTHSEDEVRFFVDGQGDFWFNLDNRPFETLTSPKLSSYDEAVSPQHQEVLNALDDAETDVFCVTCRTGDLLSVPTGYKHWFDMGHTPFVKTIRIFTDASGWTPHYTDSGVDQRYQPSPAV